TANRSARHPCGHFCFTTWPIFMFIKDLGSAARGRFPQWNSNFANTHGLRNPNLKATPPTHSSIILIDKRQHWIICKHSPQNNYNIKK
ncbi:hypothetical protein ACVGWT_00440, partial [Enterobacter hormaechei]